MKKFLIGAITIAFSFFFNNVADAQKIGIGVRGGLNLSKITNLENQFESALDLGTASGEIDLGGSNFFNGPSLNNGFIVGGNFGLFANVSFNKYLSLQPEFNYSSQGTKLTLTYLTISGEAKIKNSYFQVPLLVKLSIGNEQVRFFVNAGPYLGYWTSGKYEFKVSDGFETTKDDDEIDFSDPEIKDEVNRMDFGIAAGLGAAFKVGSGDIFVENRYSHGFSDMFKGELTSNPEYKPMKNFVVNLSAGYIYYFGK
jgi:hypothetical protein